MNGSPRIVGNSVEAEFVTTRPVAGVRCFLRSQQDRIWQDCKHKIKCCSKSACFLHYIILYTYLICPTLYTVSENLLQYIKVLVYAWH